MKIDWETVLEALKEPAREVILAVIPGVLGYLQTIPAEWAALLYFVIRGIDQYLYEKKKTIIPIKGATGLSGF